MWLPDSDAVVAVHESLVQLFIEEDDPISPSGVKSLAMLESACSRPHTGAGTVEKYSTLESKLAALFHSLTKNHPFHNGNKRTALVSLLTALHRNDRRLDAAVTDDEIFDFVLAVTADEYPTPGHGQNVDDAVSAIAHWIKQRSTPNSSPVSSMKTRHFIDRCKAAGATAKPSKGGSYVLSNNGHSIRISNSTRQLDGQVIKQFLRKLHLNESESGISVDEFQEGASDEKTQIYRFISALKRLAKT
jgi:death on curing protein